MQLKPCQHGQRRMGLPRPAAAAGGGRGGRHAWAHGRALCGPWLMGGGPSCGGAHGGWQGQPASASGAWARAAAAAPAEAAQELHLGRGGDEQPSWRPAAVRRQRPHAGPCKPAVQRCAEHPREAPWGSSGGHGPATGWLCSAPHPAALPPGCLLWSAWDGPEGLAWGLHGRRWRQCTWLPLLRLSLRRRVCSPQASQCGAWTWLPAPLTPPQRASMQAGACYAAHGPSGQEADPLSLLCWGSPQQ